jgi:hypothetical protein
MISGPILGSEVEEKAQSPSPGMLNLGPKMAIVIEHEAYNEAYIDN